MTRLLTVIGRWAASIGLRAPHAIVLAVFAASRVFYRLVLDVTFDSTGPDYFIQFVPASLVHGHFWQSLFHLHHQAPIPSLLSGLDLLLEPSNHYVALDVLYVGLGAMAAVALVDVLLRLGIRSSIAVLATVFFVAHPATAVYEAWLFYTHLAAVLMVMAMFTLLAYVREPSFKRGSWFFGVLALMAFTRSTYGLVWMGAALGVLLWLAKGARRTTLVSAVIPMALVGALWLKTRIDTGASPGEALLWPNLAFKTWYSLTPNERAEAKKSGRLSPLLEMTPMSSLAEMEAYGIDSSTRATGVPLFDARNFDGQNNYHHRGYLKVAKVYAKPDALYLMQRFPEAYLRSVYDALTVGTAQSSLVDENLAQLEICTRVARVEVPLVTLEGRGDDRSLLSLRVFLPFAWAFAALFVIGWRKQVGSARTRRIAMAFAGVSIAYTTLVTALISYADFSRYRHEIDPLYVVVAALALETTIALLGEALRRTAMFARRSPRPDDHNPPV